MWVFLSLVFEFLTDTSQDNVLELIQITEEIRRERRNRDYWERDHRHYGRPRPKYDERVSEREVIYDNTRMRRV